MSMSTLKFLAFRNILKFQHLFIRFMHYVSDLYPKFTKCIRYLMFILIFALYIQKYNWNNKRNLHNHYVFGKYSFENMCMWFANITQLALSFEIEFEGPYGECWVLLLMWDQQILVQFLLCFVKYSFLINSSKSVAYIF